MPLPLLPLRRCRSKDPLSFNTIYSILRQRNIAHLSKTAYFIHNRQFYSSSPSRSAYNPEKKAHNSLLLKQLDKRGETDSWKTFEIANGQDLIHKSHSSSSPIIASDPEKWSLKSVKKSAVSLFVQTFLPRGYPHTTHPTYLRYSFWNAVNSVSGTLIGVLSMQALLQGLQINSPTSAGVINWIIKDGFGLLGGVAYAANISSKFDAQPKRHRWIATVTMQVATLLELCTPWAVIAAGGPGFLVIASLSNIGKNISWLALSATRASIHKSLIKGDNLGDVTGKSGAQNTAASLVGTGLGVLLSYGIGNSVEVLIAIWVPLMVLNLVSLVKGNHAVITKSFDIQRSELAFEKLLDASPSTSSSPLQLNSLSDMILSPEQVAEKETFINRYKSIIPSVPLILEAPLTKVHVDSSSSFQHCFTQTHFTASENYFIHISSNNVYLWFDEKSSSQDQIKGFLHTLFIRNVLAKSEGEQGPEDLIKSTHVQLNSIWEDVFNILESKGWSTSSSHLGDLDRRIVLEKDAAA